ncbi:hypothetical protein E2C01_091571 [Portunus trituberculatus]|uniref:Uncharacterized protein n=1 Tax=Portunus trituberculatus TaxID=210409 RepID=A0A5B7JNA7_PORTR|nr:hypothetical protein [Portunus trituberculatus]
MKVSRLMHIELLVSATIRQSSVQRRGDRLLIYDTIRNIESAMYTTSTSTITTTSTTTLSPVTPHLTPP